MKFSSRLLLAFFSVLCVFFVSCVSGPSTAVRQELEADELAEDKKWSGLCVDSILELGIKDRETALTILGRPDRANLRYSQIEFTYFRLDIPNQPIKPSWVCFIFDGKDNLE